VALRGKIIIIKMYTWKIIKRLAALALSLLLLISAVACSLMQAAPPIPTTMETPPPADTSSLPSTSPLPIITYGSQGWLLTSWDMAPLWAEPETPVVGNSVKVWSNIYISDMPWSFVRVELYVNGELADSAELTLWFDDALPFSLSFTPYGPGTYQITVRANMLENEQYARDSGEDLSAFCSMTLNVA
jgi:hypothetical protein